jgi:hypothetical protein
MLAYEYLCACYTGIIAAAKVAAIPNEEKLNDFVPEITILLGTNHPGRSYM